MPSRKVRPPQDRAMVNDHRGRRSRRTSGKVPQKINRRGRKASVRVKRRGKSSPPRRRRRGHGKPGLEQAQIGGEALSAPLSSAGGRTSPAATQGLEKWVPSTEAGLQSPATNFCCACISIGVPVICELPAKHRGKHRRTGDCGTPTNPVPFVIVWSGDFRTAWPRMP